MKLPPVADRDSSCGSSRPHCRLASSSFYKPSGHGARPQAPRPSDPRRPPPRFRDETEQRPRDKAGLSQEERSGDMGGWAHISSAPLHVDRNPHCEVERHALGQVSFRSLQHQSMPRQISKGQRQPGDTSQPPHPSASNSSNQCTRVGVRNRGDNRHKRKRQPFMDSYNKYN